uniref:Uncharacterized protein n=1 Tax=Timema bartmani TaxID=61472 RepID=A0A7R9F8G7_9NEOP|nr:unnamed protein product [Timema bartmani]
MGAERTSQLQSQQVVYSDDIPAVFMVVNGRLRRPGELLEIGSGQTMQLPTLREVGLLSTCGLLVEVLQALLTGFFHRNIAPILEMNVNFRDIGGWAVVLGASWGLGKAYARGLAKRGLNIVLISDDLKATGAVAADLEFEYRVQTRTVWADLQQPTLEVYSHIAREIRDLEVSVLVNYVGLCYPQPEYLIELPRADKIYGRIIRTNVVALVKMTAMVLPQMVTRGSGVIITISAQSASIPSPMLTVYAASKAFVEKFTEDLIVEYGPKGVITQCVAPGYLSNMLNLTENPLWTPHPETVAEKSLDTVGLVATTTGFLPHAILGDILRFMEWAWPSGASRLVIYSMAMIRFHILDNFYKF